MDLYPPFFPPAEDALEALIHGVDGILVSNHGARQLDGVPATVREPNTHTHTLFSNISLLVL